MGKINKSVFKFLYTCAFEEGYIQRLRRDGVVSCHDKYDYSGEFMGGSSDCGVELRAEDFLITAEILMAMAVPMSGQLDTHLEDQYYCEGNIPTDPKSNEDYGYPLWAITGNRIARQWIEILGQDCWSSVAEKINSDGVSHLADWFCHDNLGWRDRKCEFIPAKVTLSRFWILIIGLYGLVRLDWEFPATGHLRPLIPHGIDSGGGFLTGDYGIIGLRTKTGLPDLEVTSKTDIDVSPDEAVLGFFKQIEASYLIPGNQITSKESILAMAGLTGLTNYCDRAQCDETNLSQSLLSVLESIQSSVTGSFYGYFPISSYKYLPTNSSITSQELSFVLDEDFSAVLLSGPTGKNKKSTTTRDSHGNPLSTVITYEVPKQPSESSSSLAPGDVIGTFCGGISNFYRYVTESRYEEVSYSYTPKYHQDKDGHYILDSVKVSGSAKTQDLARTSELLVKNGAARMRTAPGISKLVTIEEMSFIVVVEVIKEADVEYSISEEEYPDYASCPTLPRTNGDNPYRRYALVKLKASEVVNRDDGGYDGIFDLSELMPTKLIPKIDSELSFTDMIIRFNIIEYCGEVKYSVKYP